VFTVPEGWTQEKSNGLEGPIVISRISNGFRENLNLQVFPTSVEDGKYMLTAPFIKDLERGLRQKLKVTTFQPPAKTKVAGQFAWKTHYEAEQAGSAFRGTQWVFTTPGRGWVITWTDQPRATHPKQIEELIQSFRFIPVEYKNPKEAFAFTIPSGWVQLEPKEKGLTVMIGVPTDGWSENMNVRIGRSPTEMGQDFQGIAFAQSVQRGAIEMLAKRAPPIPLELSSPERTKVAGSFAWRWTYDVKGSPMRGAQWMVQNGNRLYTITWTSQPDKNHAEQAEAMVKSFRFIAEPSK
jgi:hypothetical protein